MKKLLFLFTALLTCFSQNLFASHSWGTEITYACVPGQPYVYKVTFTFYRDCTGIPVCSGGCGSACSRTLQIVGKSSSCLDQNFGSFNLNLVKVEDVGVDTLTCPTAKTICTNMGCKTAGSYTPGIERYVFEGTVNLGPGSYGIPSTCCEVLLSFTECCRPNNNTGSGGANAFNYALINRCAPANTPCNSSPVFTQSPQLLLGSSAGSPNPAQISFGATDPDGDSLSYALVPALQASGSSVYYVAPYSHLTPMSWIGLPSSPFPGGIRCLSLTGDMLFHPVSGSGSAWDGVVVVEVKQWRTIGGVSTMTGLVRRDIQMRVISTPPNAYPTFRTYPGDTAVSGPMKYNWEFCAGNNNCFTLVAGEYPGGIDTTYISLSGTTLPSGSTLTKLYVDSTRVTNGPRADSLRFCWTPAVSQISNVPYTFTLSATDRRCPIPGKATRTFAIRVTGAPATASISRSYTQCLGWNLSYSGNNIKSTQWQVSNTPGAFNSSNYRSLTAPAWNGLQFSDTGKFVVRLLAFGDSSCTAVPLVVYDTLYNPRKAFVFQGLPDSTICASSPGSYVAQVTGGKSPLSYNWRRSGQTAVLSTTSGLPFSALTLGSQAYVMTVTDSFGCIVRDTFVVTVNPVPSGTLTPSFTICNGEVLPISITGTSGVKYQWSTGDTTANTTISNPGVHSVTLTIPATGCSKTFNTLLLVNSLPPVNAGTDKILCAGDSVILSGSGATGYIWYKLPGTGAIGAAQSIKVAPDSTTAYALQGSTTANGKTCVNYDTVAVTVYHKSSTPVINGLSSVNRNLTNNYSVATTPGNTYQWMISNGSITNGQGTGNVSVVFTSMGIGTLGVIESNASCVSDTGYKNVMVNAGVGLSEYNTFRHLNLYPNPAAGWVNIEIETDEKRVVIEVTDLSGRILLTKGVNHSGGLANHPIDLSAFAQGMYLVHVTAGDRSAAVKLGLR